MYDINGQALAVGDKVYYARKDTYSNKGELIITTVTKIHNGYVWMDRYNSHDPENQIAKI